MSDADAGFEDESPGYGAPRHYPPSVPTSPFIDVSGGLPPRVHIVNGSTITVGLSPDSEPRWIVQHTPEYVAELTRVGQLARHALARGVTDRITRELALFVLKQVDELGPAQDTP